MITFDELKAELLNDPEFAKEYEKSRIEWTGLWSLRMAYGLLKGSESAFQEMRAMMEEWDEKKTGYFKDVARIIATHKVSVDEALDILKENHPDWNPTYYAGKS